MLPPPPLLLLLLLAAGGARATRTVHAGGVHGPTVLAPTIGVYGSTVCAVAACVAAARMNASCAIVEPQSHLWGMTAGGLSGADLRMPLGGVAREIFGPHPSPNHPPSVWNATIWALVTGAGPGAVTVVNGAGGIAGVDRAASSGGGAIAAVRFAGGLTLSARVYLDCSYEGDLLRLSGTSWVVGREAAREFNESRGGASANAPWATGALPGVSPWADAANTTLLESVAPLPAAAPGDGDDLVMAYNYRMILTNASANRLPLAPPAGYNASAMEVLRRWFRVNAAALANASLMDNKLLLVRWLGDDKVDVNAHEMPCASDMPFLQGAYPTADWPARAAIAARHEWWTRAAWEFLRTDAAVPPAMRAEAAQWGLCADEFLATGGWPPQLYVRESIRMRGAALLTQADVVGAAVGRSNASVGLSQWLIDVHEVQRVAVPPALTGRGWEVAEAGQTDTLQQAWQLTQVPYGVLTPRRAETTNLLVPVCASLTHIAFATYRLEPQYAVFGQSAAVAGVLAAAADVAVQDVDVPTLQAELRAQGQLLEPPASPSPPPPAGRADLVLAPCGAAGAPWAWNASGDGSVREAAAAGRCASVFGYSNATGARIVAAPCHTDDPSQPGNQAFDVQPAAGGAVRVRARLSGLCLAAGSGASGAAVTQVACDGGAAALWAPLASAPASGDWRLQQAGGAAAGAAGAAQLCVVPEAAIEPRQL